MIKFLTKSTNYIRVADKESADELHKQIMNETLKRGWVLSAWTEKHKERKQKGEIVEEYMLISYTITFQDEKEPIEVLDSIDYKLNSWENVDIEN